MAEAAMASGGEMMAPRTKPAASGRSGNHPVRDEGDHDRGGDDEADGEQQDGAQVKRKSRHEVKNAWM